MALAAVAGLLAPAGGATAAGEEVLAYRWRLGGVAGTVARIFVPGKGEGHLSTRASGTGQLTTELRITSRDAAGEEYWAWGARLDRRTGDAVEVWNESFYKDREKRREARIEEAGIIDIPSGIHLLRTEPPAAPRPLKLWNDGKIYPVVVPPPQRVTRKVAGEKRELDYFAIEGREVPGERVWRGRLEVWLTPDERAIPVEIIYRRSRGKVHLDLLSPPG